MIVRLQAGTRERLLMYGAGQAVGQVFAEAGITLLSAGLDEVPGVYKDIHAMMAAQGDLVETLARFDPKIVKMAKAGERPED